MRMTMARRVIILEERLNSWSCLALLSVSLGFLCATSPASPCPAWPGSGFQLWRSSGRDPGSYQLPVQPCSALATTLKPTLAGSDGEPRLMQDLHKCGSAMQK